jgi:hypothetical protein
VSKGNPRLKRLRQAMARLRGETRQLYSHLCQDGQDDPSAEIVSMYLERLDPTWKEFHAAALVYSRTEGQSR